MGSQECRSGQSESRQGLPERSALERELARSGARGGRRVKRRNRKRADVVFLHDLVPRSDVKGGSAGRIFGEKVDGIGSETPTRRKGRGGSKKERKDGEG